MNIHDARDRQTDVRQHHRLMPPPREGRGIIIMKLSVRVSVTDKLGSLNLKVYPGTWYILRMDVITEVHR